MVGVLVKALWELPTYYRHCEVAKKGLDEELRQLEDKMAEDLGGLSEREQDFYFREVNDHWVEVAQTLPRLQWYSQLIILFGFFEKVLNDFCSEYQRDKNLKVSLKDFFGQGIERARNYLVKIAGLDNSFSTPEWHSIIDLNVLRNVTVHRDGFVGYEPGAPGSMYSRLIKISGVELRQEVVNQEDAQVFFTEMVVVDAIDVFDKFIRHLISEVGASS